MKTMLKERDTIIPDNTPIQPPVLQQDSFQYPGEEAVCQDSCNEDGDHDQQCEAAS